MAKKLHSLPSWVTDKKIKLAIAELPPVPEPESIINTTIDNNGHLLIKYSNGSSQDVGRVVGENGKIPDHEIKNGEIRFEKPDGSWGAWIRVTEPARIIYQGGGSSSTASTAGLEQSAKKTTITYASSEGARISSIVRDTKTTLLDYVARTDDNPVYTGTNTTGTAQADESWTVTKTVYDANNRFTAREVLKGAWTNRASLAWTI